MLTMPIFKDYLIHFCTTLDHAVWSDRSCQVTHSRGSSCNAPVRGPTNNSRTAHLTPQSLQQPSTSSLAPQTWSLTTLLKSSPVVSAQLDPAALMMAGPRCSRMDPLLLPFPHPWVILPAQRLPLVPPLLPIPVSHSVTSSVCYLILPSQVAEAGWV